MLAHIDYLRPGTAAVRQEAHLPATEVAHQRVLPPDRVPPVFPLAIPVVVTGYQQSPSRAVPDGLDQGGGLSLRVGPPGMPHRWDATGIDVVAQEHHELLNGAERVGLT